ncbi:hypothetical protein KC960_00020 [Candidatus Saccharibacteria bacterium]|nr:hypothetical protein [Candidatus Saccharibacteria bacterium]
MIYGESTLEIETGLFRSTLLPLRLARDLMVNVPTLQYESNRTGETVEMFSFHTRSRNSSRQIVAKCIMGSSCRNKGAYLEGEYFNPRLRSALFISKHVPFVAMHTLGNDCGEFSSKGVEMLHEIIQRWGLMDIVTI